MSFFETENSMDTSPAGWQESLWRAGSWTMSVSQVRQAACPYEDSEFPHRGEYADWSGSFRGEYSAASGRWDVFCPIWHGGQAVKGLAMAAAALDGSSFAGAAAGAADGPAADFIAAAKRGAEFILRNQVSDESSEDYGHIRAYEAGSPAVNTSAILECLDGLFALADVTGEQSYTDSAVAALGWTMRRAFMPEEGLMKDDYDPKTGNFQPTRFGARDWNIKGRPLIDDGVFVIGAGKSGKSELADVALRIADRLLSDEDPAGNWLTFPPADRDTGNIHPRHAYWWGRPLWMVYRETGEQKYLDCARRSADWYVKAMRSDGGLFRHTDLDFRTPSFGHATSGIACAAILWLELIREFGDEKYLAPARQALAFCRSMQFTEVADANLDGAVLEKVVAPAGRDLPPWYLRDVGTFFYMQAVSLALRDVPQALEQS